MENENNEVNDDTVKSVYEMLHKTNDNMHNFYKHVAEHIKTLEELIVKLQSENDQLKGKQDGHE